MKKLSMLIALFSVTLIWADDIDIANEKDFEEASKKDISELALNDQAMMYLLGQGVEEDPIEALRLFTISAKQGNQYAQANLGLMYAEGFEGIDINYTEAIYWFKKAAEKGNAYAQASLGYLYENGYGVETNFEEAIKFYRLSASQGNILAHRNLGFIYKEGKGVTKDLVRSLMWFLMAGSSGDEVSDLEVVKLRGLLDDSEESEAFNLGKECISSSFSNCGYSKAETNKKPLAFVCNYQRAEPLILQIKEDRILIGSLDIKHQLKILNRNNQYIEWSDTSFMKVPFDVDHILDLENHELRFTLGHEETTLDCLKVEENEIKDYEKDMRKVMQEKGWSPRLPPLSFYLKMAENKDHPKVIHQMHLRCESLLFTKVNAIIKSFCPKLEIISEESDIKQCMGESNFSIWKGMTNDLLQHANLHHKLNIEGSYLSEHQVDSQSSVIMQAYDKSFMKFINNEQNGGCWGDTTGLLCWEEEELMCGKIREEKSMQDWFDRLTIN